MGLFGNVFTKPSSWLKPVLAGVFPGMGNYLAGQDANKANKELQEAANRQNVELWERQTAYNTPAENMKRLEAAGLSPQLAYGQVADSKMGTAPNMVAAHQEPLKNTGPGLLEALSMYSQVINAQELNKKMRLENEYTAYENRYLKSNNLIKSDWNMLKLGGRVGNYINAAGEKLGNSEFFRYLSDMAEKFGRASSEHSRINTWKLQKSNRK